MAQVTEEIFRALKAASGEYPFRVVSGSMEPLIPVGAQVRVELGGRVKPHDVVVFWDGSRLVCHVFLHANRQVLRGGRWVLTCPLRRGQDLVVDEAALLGPVLNYRLGRWERLRLAFRRWRERRR